MWLFQKQPRMKNMVRVILTDDQEIVGEEGLRAKVFVGDVWVRHNHRGGMSLYPHWRVRRADFWRQEVE